MGDQDSIFSDIQTTEVECTHLHRVLTNLVDWVIDISLMIILYLLLPEGIVSVLINTKSYSIYILVIVLMLAYRLISLLLFGKTIGMKICSVKYLNSSLQPLTGKEKMIAAIAIQTSGIKYYKAN